MDPFYDGERNPVDYGLIGDSGSDRRGWRRVGRTGGKVELLEKK